MSEFHENPATGGVGSIVNLLATPHQGAFDRSRESPLNSANQSRVTMCSDPALFQPDSYLSPDSDGESMAANTNTSTTTSHTPYRSLTSPVTAGEGGEAELPATSTARFAEESEQVAMNGLIEAECKQVIGITETNNKFFAKKDRDIEVLELTKEQMKEMLADDTGLAKDEYFDLKYFASEIGKVWEERKIVDPDSALISTPLFPDSVSPLRSIRHRTLSPGSTAAISPTTDSAAPPSAATAAAAAVIAGTNEVPPLDPSDNPDANSANSSAFEKKHPIMFRKIQRNKDRREVFNESMQKKRLEKSAGGDDTIVGDGAASPHAHSRWISTYDARNPAFADTDSSVLPGGGGVNAARSMADIRAKLKAQGPLQPSGGLGAGSGKHLMSAHTCCLSVNNNNSSHSGSGVNQSGFGNQSIPSTGASSTTTTVAGAAGGTATTTMYTKYPLAIKKKKKKAVPTKTEETPSTVEEEGCTSLPDAIKDVCAVEGEDEDMEEEPPAPPATPQTLAELLKDQRTQLANTEKSDREVYKPLLQSFIDYDERAKNKLSRLIDYCESENAAHDEALRLAAEEKERADRAFEEGFES